MNYLNTLREEAKTSNRVERRISNRRAKLLRKRGETVVWDRENEHWVWFMFVGLRHYQRATINFVRSGKSIPIELPHGIGKA